MEHLKKKKSFSWRDLLYKSLLFVATVALIVYFLPRDGKFNYQFDINKPWKYGQLIATFDFPIYKDEAVVKREQDSLLVLFQPYYELDKKIEKDAISKLKENYHTNLKGILPSIDYLRYIERTLKDPRIIAQRIHQTQRVYGTKPFDSRRSGSVCRYADALFHALS